MTEWLLLWRYKKTTGKRRAIVAAIHVLDKTKAIWPSPIPHTLKSFAKELEPKVFESYGAAENAAVTAVKNIGFKDFTT